MNSFARCMCDFANQNAHLAPATGGHVPSSQELFMVLTRAMDEDNVVPVIQAWDEWESAERLAAPFIEMFSALPEPYRQKVRDIFHEQPRLNPNLQLLFNVVDCPTWPDMAYLEEDTADMEIEMRPID